MNNFGKRKRGNSQPNFKGIANQKLDTKIQICREKIDPKCIANSPTGRTMFQGVKTIS